MLLTADTKLKFSEKTPNLSFYSGYACPTCSRCLFDMTSTWKKLDEEVAQTPMPDDYADFQVRVSYRVFLLFVTRVLKLTSFLYQVKM